MYSHAYEFERTLASSIGVEYDTMIRKLRQHPWSKGVEIERLDNGERIKVIASFCSQGDYKGFFNTANGWEVRQILRKLHAQGYSC